MGDNDKPDFVSLEEILTSNYDISCYKVITPRKQKTSRRQRPRGYEVFNEDWYLSTKGDMINAWNGYPILHQQLSQKNLVLHLMDKVWFDANTFLPVFFEACRRKGMDTVELLVSYG